MAALKSS
jgi:midasin